MDYLRAGTGARIRLKALLGLFLCVLTLFLGPTGCNTEIAADTPKPVVKAWIPCRGKSMLPNFPEYSYVQFEFGVPFEMLKAGDTVIFWDYKRSETALTHHRLVQKQGDAWIAKGDNNEFPDKSWVTKDNYIARGTGVWLKTLESPQ